MAEDLKIPGYLFGAIGNGRSNEPTLKIIKQETELCGGRILDAHVADWTLAMQLRTNLGWDGLRQFDAEQMDKAVFGIGEVSEPSIGVGREIERLLSIHRVSVLALRSCESSYQSAWIDGERSPVFNLHVYQNEDDLKMAIASFMIKVKRLQGIYH